MIKNFRYLRVEDLAKRLDRAWWIVWTSVVLEIRKYGFSAGSRAQAVAVRASLEARSLVCMMLPTPSTSSAPTSLLIVDFRYLRVEDLAKRLDRSWWIVWTSVFLEIRVPRIDSPRAAGRRLSRSEAAWKSMPLPEVVLVPQEGY